MTQEEVSSTLASARKALAEQRAEDAVRTLTHLLKDAPDDPEALSLLGVAHAARKDYPYALDCFRKSLSLRPTARTHYNVAALYKMQGYMAPAKRALREALRLDPQYPMAAKMLYELENPPS